MLFFVLLLFCGISLTVSSEYCLGIRDSIMIAHSFKGSEFGPAQNLHGATYTVDVEFSKPELVQSSNWVFSSNILT
jgi:hypothetical protein